MNRILFEHEIQKEDRLYGPLRISIFDQRIIHEKLTIDLRGRFVQSQLLIHRLLHMQSDPPTKDQFISLSKEIYRTDSSVMKIINEFENNYTSDRALNWYTRDSFLSRLLNKALRTQNIELLFYFRFFIDDIRAQLKALKSDGPTKVYRSQWMTRDELKMLQDAMGKFISINSFLSAHLDKEKAKSNPPHDKEFEEQVLFEIDARSVANIKAFSLTKEDEILFMLGSVFEIVQIKHEGKRVWLVQLKFYPKHSQAIDKKSTDTDKLLSFGHVLKTIGDLEEAEIFYQSLLHELSSNDPIHARCCEALAGVADEKGEYDASLSLYTQAVTSNGGASNKRSLTIASNYIDIGEIYRKKHQYEEALRNHEKALKILQDNSSEQYLAKRAVCYNSIGVMYQDLEDYRKALEYGIKAFDIRRKYFDSDEISLGMSSNNIGNAHYCLDHYDDAEYHYREALRFYKRQLPPSHSKIALTYNNLGVLYDNRGKFEDALRYYKIARNIYRNVYSKGHLYVKKIQENIDRVKKSMPK